jgi:signal-transduction protein with cAMP-binding, CBS, and nucleotidyltransferase domain
VLRKNAKVELIKRVPLFSHCSKKELGMVAQIADEIDLPEGKTLMREGDRGREFFVLVEGNAEVRRRGSRLNSLGTGDFFGTEQSFRSLLDRAPEVQRKVLKALADRIAGD